MMTTISMANKVILNLLLQVIGITIFSIDADLPNDRPPANERKFVSPLLEQKITEISGRMTDPILARMFCNCLPSALDTTIYKFDEDEPSTFIITGDIEAMWLRDSTNQLLPYLRFAKNDTQLRALICGAIQRQFSQVIVDPYSNAFNEDASGQGHFDDIRHPPLSKLSFEGKYELDSLAAVLKLVSRYYLETADRQCFDLHQRRFLLVIEKILKTVIDEQASSSSNLSESTYLFQRNTPVATDTLPLQGRGSPANRCGLSKSYFRPSDDACMLPYLIPANAFMTVELKQISTILSDLYPECPRAQILSNQATQLSKEIRHAIYEYGLNTNGTFSYEVDGYGNQIFMDDANIPSLLSLPYIGFVSNDDPIYLSTRRRILSSDNPYYFQGAEASGVGGPHVGLGYVWPMSILVQALTSREDDEIIECLRILRDTTAGTNFMHESFNVNDSKMFTRAWFAWVNSLFGELILKLAEERPHLIFNNSTILLTDAPLQDW